MGIPLAGAQMAELMKIYRDAWKAAGHPGQGQERCDCRGEAVADSCRSRSRVAECRKSISSRVIDFGRRRARFSCASSVIALVRPVISAIFRSAIRAAELPAAALLVSACRMPVAVGIFRDLPPMRTVTGL